MFPISTGGSSGWVTKGTSLNQWNIQMKENIWCSNINPRCSNLPIILVQSSILPGQLFQMTILNPWKTPKRKWVPYFKIIFIPSQMPLTFLLISRERLSPINEVYRLPESESSVFEIWNVKLLFLLSIQKVFIPYSKSQFVSSVSKTGHIYNPTYRFIVLGL